MSIRSIDPASISTPELHAYLLSAVAPRPIAFASTVDREGRVNLSPFSFFNCFGANPPTLIFSPARRVRDNTTKHTLENVREVPEVVINVVNYPIVEQMSLSSTEYEKGINEFIKSGLTELPSVKVAPPRVGESPVSFECKVEQIIETGNQGGAGNLIICKVVMVHLQERYLDEKGELDTRKLDLVARMGGSWYCRATGDALFEIPKPIRTRGIGVDQLPASIRNSDVLTGNNLGRLGNVESFPLPEAVAEWSRREDIAALLKQHEGAIGSCKNALHQMARNLLEEGDTEGALKTLLVYESFS